jgi:hypothetical protein
MKFSNVLVGQNEIAQQALDSFFESIKDEEEKILWYPSAFDDYRDLVETTPERLQVHDIKIAPNIIIHSDRGDWAKNALLKYEENFVIFKNSTVQIIVKSKHELLLSGSKDRKFFSHKIMSIFLLKLKIVSIHIGEIERNVFYFCCNNIFLFEHIILKNKLPISHFVKVRDCPLSTSSIIYGFIGYLGTKYLFIDSHTCFDYDYYDSLISELNIKPKKFDLKPLYRKNSKYPNYKDTNCMRWSHSLVQLFKVEHHEENLTKEDLDSILNFIDIDAKNFKGMIHRN